MITSCRRGWRGKRYRCRATNFASGFRASRQLTSEDLALISERLGRLVIVSVGPRSSSERVAPTGNWTSRRQVDAKRPTRRTGPTRAGRFWKIAPVNRRSQKHRALTPSAFMANEVSNGCFFSLPHIAGENSPSIQRSDCSRETPVTSKMRPASPRRSAAHPRLKFARDGTSGTEACAGHALWKPSIT